MLPPERLATRRRKSRPTAKPSRPLPCRAILSTTRPPGAPPALSPIGPTGAMHPAAPRATATMSAPAARLGSRIGQRHLQLQDHVVLGEGERVSARCESRGVGQV